MMKSSIIFVILYCSFLFGQHDQDARMLSLSGTYTNIAEGFSCVGVNPANLSYGSDYSMNLGSVNASFWNNSLSLNLINTLNNANMIDSTSIDYYDKDRLKTVFDERSRFRGGLEFREELIVFLRGNQGFAVAWWLGTSL